MTTRAGVGMSRHHSPSIVGREAAEQALEKAGVAEPDFVFVFPRSAMTSVLYCRRCERPPGVCDARGKTRSAATTQMNRFSPW